MTDPNPTGPDAGPPASTPTAAAAHQRLSPPSPPDTRTLPLTLQRVPARQGLGWVKEAFQTFVRRPLAMAGLFALFMFSALMVMLLPLVGPVLLLGSLPLVSLAFMLATQTVLAGRFPMPGIVVAPLRTDRQRRLALLQLGFAYALASFVIMALSNAVDGGRFEALQDAMSRGAEGSQAVSVLLDDGQLVFGVAVRLVLAGLLAVPFWHAPALVHWSGQGMVQALFSSTLAVWRNRGAFLVYVLAWGGALGLFAFAANFIGLVFGAPQLMSIVMMPAALMFSTVFYTSLYFTFVDCFGERAREAAAA